MQSHAGELRTIADRLENDFDRQVYPAVQDLLRVTGSLAGALQAPVLPAPDPPTKPKPLEGVVLAYKANPHGLTPQQFKDAATHKWGAGFDGGGWAFPGVLAQYRDAYPDKEIAIGLEIASVHEHPGELWNEIQQHEDAFVHNDKGQRLRLKENVPHYHVWPDHPKWIELVLARGRSALDYGIDLFRLDYFFDRYDRNNSPLGAPSLNEGDVQRLLEGNFRLLDLLKAEGIRVWTNGWFMLTNSNNRPEMARKSHVVDFELTWSGHDVVVALAAIKELVKRGTKCVFAWEVEVSRHAEALACYATVAGPLTACRLNYQRKDGSPEDREWRLYQGIRAWPPYSWMKQLGEPLTDATVHPEEGDLILRPFSGGIALVNYGPEPRSYRVSADREIGWVTEDPEQLRWTKEPIVVKPYSGAIGLHGKPS